MPGSVRFQHIRSATGVLDYGGKRFLIDPMLSPKDGFPGFEGSLNSHIRNPTVELPVKAETLISEVDAILATHLHTDHWDDVATALVPKEKTVFVQDEKDADVLRGQGFTDVRVVSTETGATFGSAHFTKTPCQHGSDALYATPPLAEKLGSVSGYLFRDPSGATKSICFVSDTIWTSAVEKMLKESQPDIVVINAGDAQLLGGFGSIIMGKEDVSRVHAAVPKAIIVAVHLEAVNHCIVTRKELKEYVAEKGISDYVRIPNDGEVLEL